MNNEWRYSSQEVIKIMNKWLSIPLPTQTTIACTWARISTGQKTEHLGKDLNDNRPLTRRDFVSHKNLCDRAAQSRTGVQKLSHFNDFFSILLKPEKEMPGSRAATQSCTWVMAFNGNREINQINNTDVGTKLYEGFLYERVSYLQHDWYLGAGLFLVAGLPSALWNV